MSETLTAPADTAPAAATTTAPAMTGSGSYDWKAAGVDDGGLVMVGERQWKNPGDLLTSYKNLEALRGVPPDRLLKMPTEKDGPEAWNAIYDKMGRPATADKYVIPVPAGDKGEFASEAKKWFHEAGVSQAMATKLAEKWNGFTAQQQNSQKLQSEQQALSQVSDLKQAWGGEYEKNSAVVDKAAEAFGMTTEILSALKTAAGPKAAMEFLFNIGTRMGTEDSSVPGMGSQSSTFAMTPEMATAELSRLKSDSAFSQLFSSQDPKARMDARNQIDRLVKIANPGSQPAVRR